MVSLMHNYKTFEQYFYEIKNIWSQLNTKNRIIPFCTPMKFRPKFFIIGLNHSVFSNDDKEANLIANNFSNSIPKLNTYTNHNHKFAKGLRAVIRRVHEEVDDFDTGPNDDWLGTNRIAIQTDAKGASPIIVHKDYKIYQQKMDNLLRSLIIFMKPRNVLLVGKDASEIFGYNKNSSLNLMKFSKFQVCSDTNKTTNIIPIHHFSRGSFYQPAADRIIKAIKEGFCDYS